MRGLQTETGLTVFWRGSASVSYIRRQHMCKALKLFRAGQMQQGSCSKQRLLLLMMGVPSAHNRSVIRLARPVHIVNLCPILNRWALVINMEALHCNKAAPHRCR